VTVNYWKTAASGDWNTASNCTDGLPGSNGDGVIIGPAGTYTVTLSAAGSSSLSLLMLAADATFSETSTGTLNLGDEFILQAGTAILRNANTIANGVNLQGGLLETSNASALGSAAFTISGGEFVGLSTETVANQLKLSGDFTIAAATGKTLTLDGSSGWSLDNGSTLNFGDAAHKGTVVWYTPLFSSNPFFTNFVEVHDGTLKAGDQSFEKLFFETDTTTVDAGATIDMNGFGTQIYNLQGQGVITDTGGGNLLIINNGNFSGQINGPISLLIDGTVTLSGGGTYTGFVEIASGSTLNLSGTTTRTVKFDGAGTLSLSNAAHVAGTLNVTAASGGNDTVNGGSGDDTFAFGASLKANDKVNGGAGTDTVTLNGGYSGLTFTSTTMVNVEKLKLAAGHSYTLTTNNATVASGQTLTIDGSALSASNVLTFSGVVEINSHFVIIGGKGADKLTGGVLSDTFVYSSAAQSTSTHYDTITDFKFGTDIFDTPGAAGTITGINTKVSSGTLSTASFDANLTTAMSGHLTAHHAILFTPTTGTLHGQTFLVVDLNGVAGYQSGSDLVIRMNGTTGTLAAGGFH